MRAVHDDLGYAQDENQAHELTWNRKNLRAHARFSLGRIMAPYGLMNYGRAPAAQYERDRRANSERREDDGCDKHGCGGRY